MSTNYKKLSEEELAIYEWQMCVADFGEEGQLKLKNTTALVSRCGGLGGPLCYHLASAGIGKIIIAHAGNVKHSDLNRQILMTHDWLGKPRVESAKRKLKALNPKLEIETVNANISTYNAKELITKADIVFDCAPLFSERMAMNDECVRQNKPMIEAAMFDMEGHITTIIPGQTPCLRCIFPDIPDKWQRKFPVFGAVSSIAAAIAAMEGIKVMAGFGEILKGNLLKYDARTMEFTKFPITKRPDCKICGKI